MQCIEFIVYRSDDFLQYIFQSDDPNNRAVFIYDKCQQLMSVLEMFQHVADRHILRHLGRFAHHRLDIKRSVVRCDSQQIFHVDNTQK